MTRDKELRIVSDIPIPRPRGLGAATGVILEHMRVGDSIFVPGIDSRVAHSTFRHARLKLGYKITTRKEGDGIRIWRAE